MPSQTCALTPQSNRALQALGRAASGTPFTLRVSRHIKRLLSLAALMLCSASAMPEEVTSWASAVSKQEGTGREIVFRYAKDFREGFQRSAFPDRVILVWKYKSESGMPLPTEREAMDRMEDLLEPLVEKSGTSVLALVSTGENLREWIFYAKTEQEFLAALNKVLTGQPRFPIEIHAGRDSQWSSYERFRKGVRE